MANKLTKRGQGVYGPLLETGSFFIDDLTAPEPGRTLKLLARDSQRLKFNFCMIKTLLE